MATVVGKTFTTRTLLLLVAACGLSAAVVRLCLHPAVISTGHCLDLRASGPGYIEVYDDKGLPCIVKSARFKRDEETHSLFFKRGDKIFRLAGEFPKPRIGELAFAKDGSIYLNSSAHDPRRVFAYDGEFPGYKGWYNHRGNNRIFMMQVRDSHSMTEVAQGVYLEPHDAVDALMPETHIEQGSLEISLPRVLIEAAQKLEMRWFIGAALVTTAALFAITRFRFFRRSK